MEPLEIKICLMRSGVRQVQIARRCGVSPTQVQRVIDGSKSAHVRRAIAEVIGKPTHEIWPDHPNEADNFKSNY